MQNSDMKPPWLSFRLVDFVTNMEVGQGLTAVSNGRVKVTLDN